MIEPPPKGTFGTINWTSAGPWPVATSAWQDTVSMTTWRFSGIVNNVQDAWPYMESIFPVAHEALKPLRAVLPVSTNNGVALVLLTPIDGLVIWALTVGVLVTVTGTAGAAATGVAESAVSNPAAVITVAWIIEVGFV